MGPFNQSGAKRNPEQWERDGARRETASAQDAKPTETMHVRWNRWERARLERIAAREGISMQALVRSVVRKHLLIVDEP